VRSNDLGAAAGFAARNDNGHVVLCHMGKPDVLNEPVSVWAGRLAPLASLPHVSCKISGLVTEAGPGNWTPDSLLPYAVAALELFGPERVMFGSDWPVCLHAAESDQVYGLAAAAASLLSDSERELFWGGNAERVYGLDPG
jgi:L-fuconolactonase